MTSQKILTTLVTIVVVALLWTACKKEQSLSNPQQSPSSPTLNAHNGGVVEDNPEFLSKVPLIISSNFMEQNSGGVIDFSASARGGKPRPGGGGGSDTQAPTVSFTSPTDGGTVNVGTVPVSVNANDNVGVTSVSLWVNSTTQVGGTLTSAPYNFSWDASSYNLLSPTLTATAKDAAGHSTSVTITVHVGTSGSGGGGGGGGGGGTLQTYVMLSAPTPGNQGREMACVPFATTYAARSIEQYYRTGASSYNVATNVFSPEYVYDQTKFSSDCGSGTSVGTALELMKQSGVCTWQTMPFSDANGCSVVPTGAQNAEAANYKIGGYSKIISADLTSIKTMLSNNHPVIFNTSVDDGFVAAKTDFTWSAYSGSGGLPHCLTIIGYDDKQNGGAGAFRVINSWGTTWGGGGFCWISYSWFPQAAGYYAYVMNY